MARLVNVTMFWIAAAVPGLAAADDISFQLETSVASTYMLRGIPQYATRDVPSSQNSASLRVDHVGAGALTVGVWTAVAMQDYADQPGTATELDLSVGYELRTRALALIAGYSAGLFPSHLDGAPIDGQHEFSAAITYDTRYVTPAATAYVEVLRQQGVYLQLAAIRNLHHHTWTFTPAVSMGGATYRKYAGGDRAAAPHLNDVTAAVAARRDFDAGLYASAKISYSLIGTPSVLVPMDSWGFDGRSTVFGVLAVGVAR